MKIKNRPLYLRAISCFLSFLLIGNLILPASATDTIESLNQSTAALQNELASLNQELTGLSNEISSISAQAASIASEITQVKSELAIAKGQEASQYEAMKTRIKYMYENGNMNMFELLLSSSCMAEFLKKADFISTVAEYDRALLKELTALQESIEAKEQLLLEKQDSLTALQASLSEKEQSLQSKIVTLSNDLATQSAELEAAKLKAAEEARRAEEEARKAREEALKAEQALKQEVVPVVPEKPVTPTPSTPSTPSISTPAPEPDIDYAASASDLELFAALIECEAGSTDYEGMLAVASVVVNRMKSSYYPNTLRGVVFQSGQFPPAHNGSVDKKLKRGVKDSCLQVAQDALSGKNNVGDCLSFRASSSGHAGTIIGNNVFF